MSDTCRGKEEKPGNGAVTTGGSGAASNGFLPGGDGSTTWVIQTQDGEAETLVTNSRLPVVRTVLGALTSHIWGLLLWKARQADLLPEKDLRHRREMRVLRWEGISILKTCTGELRWAKWT